MNAKLKRRLEFLEHSSINRRSVLEEIRSGKRLPSDLHRVVVRCVVGTPNLNKSTCCRSLSSDGVLSEYIQFKYDDLSGADQLSEEERERWIASLPIQLA